jgi:MFS family permease
MIWLLFAGYGLYQGFAEGASKAIVADFSPAEHKGAAMGFFYMCVGFGTLAGNLIGGLLWDRYGAPVMFMLCGTFAIISAIGLLTLGKKPMQK